MGVWESLVKAWVGDGLLQGWGHGVQQYMPVGSFETGHHYLHYLYHSLAPGK